MASDWFFEGMSNWLIKGLRANWMFISKGNIGKLGNNLISSFMSRTDTVQTDT